MAMNGGRLSDEEAMAQGLQQVRARLAESTVGDGPPLQALRMIAMRFPEEAEELEALWETIVQSDHRERIELLLARVEQQYAEDCADA